MENELWKLEKQKKTSMTSLLRILGRCKQVQLKGSQKGKKSQPPPSIPEVPETSDPVLHSLNPEIQAPETTDHGLDLQK